MTISGFRHILCGAPVNVSEHLAIDVERPSRQASRPWVLTMRMFLVIVTYVPIVTLGLLNLPL